MITPNVKEKYKIYEFSSHCELVLADPDQIQTHSIFFFAGYNEHSSKYLYLFKSFFEDVNINFKIIFPYLPTYKMDQVGFSTNQKFTSVQSWYRSELSKASLNPKIFRDQTQTDFITKFIQSEAEYLGGTEKIILMGFSQGGFYLLDAILCSLKAKFLFCMCIKSPSHYFTNPEKDKSDSLINQNHFYLYYSKFEKVVSFYSAMLSLNKLIGQLPHVTFHFDNGRKHEVDIECLNYLKTVINCYLGNNKIAKF